MKDEFLNRMDKQREVLESVNKKVIINEELFGLSRKAIERWTNVNNIEINSRIVSVLLNISDKLNFLACKSQEQISDEYILLSKEISSLHQDLNRILV